MASSCVQYETTKQAERVPIYCKQTGKLLHRVSAVGEWPADLRQWIWCRNCHHEHEITKEHIEEARTYHARPRITHRAKQE
jgi:hypothetical protein